MHRLLRSVLASPAFVAAIVILGGQIRAQSVWSGFDYSFSKALDTDPNLPANQDRITSNVWITRGTQKGIYNIHDETAHADGVSPIGTRWATELNNPGKTIAATNWNNLTFTDWVTAYGGQGTQGLPNRLLTYNAVVNLVADNTYLDLRFTNWWSGPGGAFAYERAPAPPPSTSGDYNLNGVVDAADYVVWRDTLSQSVSPLGSDADGNANGTIDAGDYDFWRARYGDILMGSAIGDSLSAGSVPEPASWALVLCALLVVNAIPRASR